MILGDFTYFTGRYKGIAGQIGLDIIGIDAIADARDLVASIKNGDNTGIILNGIGLIPVIVVQNIKYLDNLSSAKHVEGALSGSNLIELMQLWILVN